MSKTALINSNYIKVNIGLILFFTAGLVFFVYTDMPVTCFYKENFGVLCPTCGFSRDFKNILQISTKELINPLSLTYFYWIVVVFLTRILNIGLVYFSKRVQFAVAVDALIVVGLLIQYCLA